MAWRDNAALMLLAAKQGMQRRSIWSLFWKLAGTGLQ